MQNPLKGHHLAPVISVLVCAGIVISGVSTVRSFLQNSQREHMDLVMALSKSGEEASLLKVIDEKMNVPMETKVNLARTITTLCTAKRLPVDLMCGVIDVETGGTWNPRLVSPKGARGLLQVMPATGRVYLRAERVDPSDIMESLMDPVTSALVGISVLADYHEQAVLFRQEASTDYGMALALYNEGPKASGISDYSRAVLEAAKKYKARGV